MEADLGAAMGLYVDSTGEPPRILIIAAERKRTEVAALFQIAMDAIDAQSPVWTGHTNFGALI